MLKSLKRIINKHFLNKKVRCDIAFNCVNYDYDTCKHCSENLSINNGYHYESKVECWGCGNRNVVKGYKCNNCGEIV